MFSVAFYLFFSWCLTFAYDFFTFNPLFAKIIFTLKVKVGLLILIWKCFYLDVVLF